MNLHPLLSSLIKEYLNSVQVLQLATATDNQPWVCNVHFAADDEFNLYWLSKPTRRHSQDIAKNKKISAAVAIKFPEHPVIGISIEGDAEISKSSEGVEAYHNKFKLSESYKSTLLDGSSVDKFYCLKPRLFVLFDEEKFPDSPRQEWLIGNTQ